MILVEAISEVGLTVLMLLALRVLAGRKPEPKLEDFGPLEPGE